MRWLYGMDKCQQDQKHHNRLRKGGPKPETALNIHHSPLGTPGIRRNNNCILPIGYFLLDVRHHARFGKEVVDWDIKEPLDLRGVEVHRDDVVGAGDGE